MIKKKYKWILFCILTLLLVAALPACTNQAAASHPAMLPLGQMPDEVQSAPVSVQQAYQFAAANPDIMIQVPCYCGCGAMGHTSNYSCYVQGVDAGGKISYDTHALGCSTCVDITQAVIRMQNEGSNAQEIRAYVDSTFSQYGPSNMP